MKAILAILMYTVRQHLRTKVLHVIFLFGVVLLLGGFIVSSLAAHERLRMLVNLGLSGIEFISLITIVFVMSTLVLEEMESRSIYLILTHPISRTTYLIGRYAGTLVSIGVGIGGMMVLHLVLLMLYGWQFQLFYLGAVALSFLKIAVVSAIALFFSLFSTSAPLAMVFTFFIWVIGHFSEELRFMGTKATNVLAKGIITVMYYISPNLSYYNLRDFGQAPAVPGIDWVAWILIYSATYIGVCLVVSNFLFSQKEF